METRFIKTINGWQATSTCMLNADRELTIRTARHHSHRDLICTSASVGHVEQGFVRHVIHQDFNEALYQKKVPQVTEKAVRDQHQAITNDFAVKELITKVNRFYGVEDKVAAAPVAAPVNDTMQCAKAAAKVIRPYLSVAQMKVINTFTKGEEGEWFLNKVIEIAEVIKTMPVTYAQNGKGDQAVVHLHYFHHGSDWYITEKDMDGGVDQAFGFAILNGDTQNAELGYISIAELVESGVELDLHFEACTLEAVKARMDRGLIAKAFAPPVPPKPVPSPVQAKSEASEAKVAEKSTTVLYQIEHFSDLYADACVRNEASQLMFLSVYGRDTAIKELMARISLGKLGELRLRGVGEDLSYADKVGHTVALANVDSLEKVTGRMPKGLFGELTHMWVFQPAVQAPDKGAKQAWLIEDLAPSPQTTQHMRERVWQAVCDLATTPMLPHWREPVLAAIWEDMVFELGKKGERKDVHASYSAPIGNVVAMRVVLTDDFPARVSALIRAGVIGLEPR